MKLVVVLMLTALPLFCYAGSGCSIIEYVIKLSTDPKVSQIRFIEELREYIPGTITEMALMKFKQCFLNQSKETLANVDLLMETIYKSNQCADY